MSVTSPLPPLCGSEMMVAVVNLEISGRDDEYYWAAHLNGNLFVCDRGNDRIQVFDKTGKGVSGPPGDANQDLPSYPLRVESGLLYILVELDALMADADTGGNSRRGHDACLKPRGEDARQNDRKTF